MNARYDSSPTPSPASTLFSRGKELLRSLSPSSSKSSTLQRAALAKAKAVGSKKECMNPEQPPCMQEELECTARIQKLPFMSKKANDNLKRLISMKSVAQSQEFDKSNKKLSNLTVIENKNFEQFRGTMNRNLPEKQAMSVQKQNWSLQKSASTHTMLLSHKESSLSSKIKEFQEPNALQQNQFWSLKEKPRRSRSRNKLKQKQSPFCLKNKFGFLEGSKTINIKMKKYSMENSFCSIKDILKQSQELQIQEEEEFKIGEESKSQVCKIFSTSRKSSKAEEIKAQLEIPAEIQVSTGISKRSSNRTLKQKLVITKSYIKFVEGSSSRQETRRRCMTGEKIKESLVNQRRRVTDQNEFEEQYLKQISDFRDKHKGQLHKEEVREQLKAIFYENSSKRLMAEDLLKFMHSQMTKRSSNLQNPYFQRASVCGDPFSNLESWDEDCSESFELKSDFCIDYEGEEAQSSTGWKSIRDELEETKLTFRDFRGAMVNRFSEGLYKVMLNRNSDTNALLRRKKFFLVKNDKNYSTTNDDLSPPKAFRQQDSCIEPVAVEIQIKILENNEQYRRMIHRIYEHQQLLIFWGIPLQRKDLILKPEVRKVQEKLQQFQKPAGKRAEITGIGSVFRRI